VGPLSFVLTMKFQLRDKIWEFSFHEANTHWRQIAQCGTDFIGRTHFEDETMWPDQLMWGDGRSAIMFGVDARESFPPIITFYIIDVASSKVVTIAIQRGPAWVMI